MHSSSNVTQLADELGKFVTDATHVPGFDAITGSYMYMPSECLNTCYLIALVEMTK